MHKVFGVWKGVHMEEGWKDGSVALKSLHQSTSNFQLFSITFAEKKDA